MCSWPAASVAVMSGRGGGRGGSGRGAGRCQQLPPLVQRLLERRGRVHGGAAGQGLLQPGHAAAQAFGLHRLEQVVQGLRVEGAHRVLVVGGHEDQLRHGRGLDRPALGQFGRRRQPVLARHPDVQEQHLRLQPQRGLDGAVPVAHASQHLQVGPGLRQFGAQGLREQRLVFGDQGGAAVLHGSQG
jgi:hypothetical protein